MKEQAIAKINKMGKVGRIIATILLVFLGIGAAGCLVGFFGINVLPKGFMTISGDVVGEIKVDLTKINSPFTADEIEEVKNGTHPFVSTAVKNGFNVTEANENSFIMRSDKLDAGFDFRNLKFTVFVAFLVVATAFITMLAAKKLCKAFEKCTSPFEDNVINKMKNLAYSLLPWIFALSIADGSLGNPFNPKFSLGINFGMIFVVLIVFALIYVFKYGAMLQQESDETL